MIYTPKEKDFINQYKEIFTELFKKKVDELTVKMIADKENRDRMADTIIELQNWQREIGILKKKIEVEKDNFI